MHFFLFCFFFCLSSPQVTGFAFTASNWRASPNHNASTCVCVCVCVRERERERERVENCHFTTTQTRIHAHRFSACTPSVASRDLCHLLPCFWSSCLMWVQDGFVLHSLQNNWIDCSIRATVDVLISLIGICWVQGGTQCTTALTIAEKATLYSCNLSWGKPYTHCTFIYL